VQKEIQIRGSRGYCWDFQKAINLVSNGQVKLAPLISHRRPLSDLPQAFELLLNPDQKAIKVVIQI
jgi:L-gulonate 5-dehydrogenase